MVVAQVAELRLGERFCGPPASANGGYACGAIAEAPGHGRARPARDRLPDRGTEAWAVVEDTVMLGA